MLGSTDWQISFGGERTWTYKPPVPCLMFPILIFSTCHGAGTSNPCARLVVMAAAEKRSVENRIITNSWIEIDVYDDEKLMKSIPSGKLQSYTKHTTISKWKEESHDDVVALTTCRIRLHYLCSAKPSLLHNTKTQIRGWCNGRFDILQQQLRHMHESAGIYISGMLIEAYGSKY